MHRHKLKWAARLLICIIGLVVLCAASSLADDDHDGRGYIEGDDRHGVSFPELDNEGNETTGQLVAVLLLAANFPVVLSILIKWTTRFVPIGAEPKKALANFNRMQKKALMWIHHYLNMIIMGFAMWHWMVSRCSSTILPELGLMVMVFLIASGALMKFKLCPRLLRKNVFKIHTQPVVLTSMILVLSAGHLILD